MDDVNALRSDKPQMIPTVMSKDEVASVLSLLPQRYLLIGQLLYGHQGQRLLFNLLCSGTVGFSGPGRALSGPESPTLPAGIGIYTSVVDIVSPTGWD